MRGCSDGHKLVLRNTLGGLHKQLLPLCETTFFGIPTVNKALLLCQLGHKSLHVHVCRLRILLLLGFLLLLRGDFGPENCPLTIAGLAKAKIGRYLSLRLEKIIDFVFTDFFIHKLAAYLSQAFFPRLSAHLDRTHTSLYTITRDSRSAQHILTIDNRHSVAREFFGTCLIKDLVVLPLLQAPVLSFQDFGQVMCDNFACIATILIWHGVAILVLLRHGRCRDLHLLHHPPSLLSGLGNLPIIANRLVGNYLHGNENCHAGDERRG